MNLPLDLITVDMERKLLIQLNPHSRFQPASGIKRVNNRKRQA